MHVLLLVQGIFVLDQKLFDFQFHPIDGRFQLRSFIRRYGASDDRPRNTAGTA